MALEEVPADPASLASEGQEKSVIDEKMLHEKAHQYMCHLLEVRNWLSECLDDPDVPTVTEIEKNLSNGVLLARLSHWFAPTVVPKGKIFDVTQDRYRQNDCQLHYRHSDNIMLWRRAMESVRLPEIFIPETADVYEGRNIKTIFCLYALAMRLHRMRIAPPIRSQSGQAVFTADEYDVMKEQLKDTKLPEFGDVAGLLDENMSADEKAVALALHEITLAVDAKDNARLLASLRNTDISISYVHEERVEQYMCQLVEQRGAGEEKHALTRDGVQSAVDGVNETLAVSRLQLLVEQILKQEAAESDDALHAVLEDLQLFHTRPSSFWLVWRLLKDRVLDGHALTPSDVRRIVDEAQSLLTVRIACENGNKDELFSLLTRPVLYLQPKRENVSLYLNRLRYDFEGRPSDFYLTRDDIAAVIADFEQMSPEAHKLYTVTTCVDRHDYEQLTVVLRDLTPDVAKEDYTHLYAKKLEDRDRKTDLTLVTLRALIEETNAETEKAYEEANKLLDLNHALIAHDAINAQKAFVAIDWLKENNNTNYHEEQANWYVAQLMAEMEKRTGGGAEEKSPFHHGGHAEQPAPAPTPSGEQWYWHEFPLGTLALQTTTRERKPEKTWLLDERMFTASEIEAIFDDVNVVFTRHYEENEDSVRKSQDLTRRFLQNKKSQRESADLARKNDAARVIQHKYRQYRAEKDGQELRNMPSLRLVRKFVTYLQDRDYDVTEELEIEETKCRVTQLLSANQQLEDQLAELDEKIGLLVKNRINLQDVVSHKDKIADAADRFSARRDSVKKGAALEGVEPLEQLAWHLQTEPQWLANVVEGSSAVPVDVLAPVFGHLTEKREEFLLVRLLCELLLRDVEKAGSLDAFTHARSLKTVADVLNSRLCSSALGQLSAQPAIATVLDAFFTEAPKLETFNLDPVDVFASMHGGAKTDAQRAMEEPRVRAVLDSSKQFLAQWSERIMLAVCENNTFPACIQYITAFLSISLHDKFAHAGEENVQKALIEVIYELYIRRGLRSVKGGQGDSHEKLEAIASFCGLAVRNKGYANAHWFLTSLNRQVKTIHDQFKALLSRPSLLPPSLYAIYGCDVSFDPAHRPTLSLSGTQIDTLLNRLKEDETKLFSSSSTPLRALLQECHSPVEGDRSVTLHLHPLDGDEHDQKMHQLFVRTKASVVSLLLSGCVGADIVELLQKEATPDSERVHKEMFNQEGFPSIAARQAATQAQLDQLEASDRVSKDDKYQAVVTDIANDIRLATRRRNERVEQRAQLGERRSRLEAERAALEQRLEQYEVYLDTCLGNMTRTSRRLSFRPTTKQAGKVAKARSTLDEPTAVKATVEKLFRKGVLLDIAGEEHKNMKKTFGSPSKKMNMSFNTTLDSTSSRASLLDSATQKETKKGKKAKKNKLSKMSVEFASSEKKGIFKVTLFDGKNTVSDSTFDFQDLLARQFSEDSRFPVGDISFSVAHFVTYINKKFYNK